VPRSLKWVSSTRSESNPSAYSCFVCLATGKPPWPEFTNNLAALFHVATSKNPPPMPPDASQQLCDFLSRCEFRV
jgi:serine/threonine protein kinase